MIAKLNGVEIRIVFRNILKGKSMQCYLLDVEANTKISEGFSVCHKNDNFCYETGRKIALKKAISHLSKVYRKIIWETYFARKGNQNKRSISTKP